jgi:hypothetical protein
MRSTVRLDRSDPAGLFERAAPENLRPHGLAFP